MPSRPQIAAILTYFGLFDESMPAGFRQERLSAGARVRDLLTRVSTCRATVVVDSADAAVSAAEALRNEPLDALVVVPTIATPPEWAASVARSRPDLPVVIVAARELDSIPDDYDTEMATRNSLLVGVAMLTNALLRESRAFELVLGTLDDPGVPSMVGAALLSAQAASTLHRTRLLAFGDSIPGYSDIEATEAELAKIGVSVARVTEGDVARWAAATTDEDIGRAVRSAHELYRTGVDDAYIRMAARVTCAVRKALSETGATAGTVNCHGPLLRDSPALGVTACLAVTQLAQDGIMLSCTGDLPAALALTVGRLVAGSALYCELYAVDRPGDWILVANGGEGDTAAAVPGTAQLLVEDHYMGVNGPGVAVTFSIPDGPATLISLSPLRSAGGGWRLILAEGETIGSRHTKMEGPNAMVRIRGLDAMSAFTAWCTAGASHHAVLLPGHHSGVLTGAAKFLGIETMTVSR